VNIVAASLLSDAASKRDKDMACDEMLSALSKPLDWVGDDSSHAGFAIRLLKASRQYDYSMHIFILPSRKRLEQSLIVLLREARVPVPEPARRMLKTYFVSCWCAGINCL
jgi:hypothetical protein